MFNYSSKKEALKIHEKARSKYEKARLNFNKEIQVLYEERQNTIKMVRNIESYINSIAKKPKEFEIILRKINLELQQFSDTEKYAQEAYNEAFKAGVGSTVGVGTGVGVASLAPTAAMWVATTFGTASTGTAISSLSGAVATKAALAWLGGGALSVGGAGIAGGQALLALAGPIGWSIAGVSVVATSGKLTHKNKKIAEEAIAEARLITISGARLKENTLKIKNLYDETKLLRVNINKDFTFLKQFEGMEYINIPYENQIQLGTFVNNTYTMTTLVNKIIT